MKTRLVSSNDPFLGRCVQVEVTTDAGMDLVFLATDLQAEYIEAYRIVRFKGSLSWDLYKLSLVAKTYMESFSSWSDAFVMMKLMTHTMYESDSPPATSHLSTFL